MYYFCINIIFVTQWLGILSGGADDFESGDDLYDAIGDLLHEIASEKEEDDIRDLCEQFLCIMKPMNNTQSGEHKVLDAPVNLGQMAANLETTQQDITSIWVVNRDDGLVSIFFIPCIN